MVDPPSSLVNKLPLYINLTVDGLSSTIRLRLENSDQEREMSISSRIELEGRSYEVVCHPELRDESMGRYCQVYRLRKNGSQGLELSSIQPKYRKAYLLAEPELKLMIKLSKLQCIFPDRPAPEIT